MWEKQAIDHLNIFNSMLDACKDVDPVSNFHTMVLICDTSSLFGLTLFKDYLINYVECDILVKDVTTVKNATVIGTTTYKFENTKGDDV